MSRGTIKFLIQDQGFGIIQPEGQLFVETDLFFHRADVLTSPEFDQLRTGQHVAFDIVRDEHRETLKATHIQADPSRRQPIAH